MNKKRIIAKKMLVFAVLAVIMGCGVVYHLNALERAENELGEANRTIYNLRELENGFREKLATPEEVLAEVNKLRAEKGVKPLVLDEQLNISAMRKAQDMKVGEYFDHVNPKTGKHGYEYIDTYGIEGCNSRERGENITKNAVYNGKSANERIAQLAKSKPHYEAMIDPVYTKMGWSMTEAYSRETGSFTVIGVQHFCG